MEIVIDLETLDTAVTALPLSIGCCAFDVGKPFKPETFYVGIDLYSTLHGGAFTVSVDTLRWWYNQPNDARSDAMNGSSPLTLALKDLCAWVKNLDGDQHHLWGNGAGFDNPIIHRMYAATDVEDPFVYWNDRCYRTMKSLFKYIPKPRFAGTKHNALDDAVFEAEHLHSILRHIKKT